MIVTHPCAISRHLSAALRAEREAYLGFLRSQNRRRSKLKDAFNYTIHVVDWLNLKKLRRFTALELQSAATAWSHRDGKLTLKTDNRRACFLRYAREFLRFHKKLTDARKWNDPLDRRVELFRDYLKIELGFSTTTIDHRTWALNHFLRWLVARQIGLAHLGVVQVESYFDYLHDQGWTPRTISSAVGYIKVFLRFAERKQWTGRGMSQAVFGPQNPVIQRKLSVERGPRWYDVQSLIESADGAGTNDCRAKAILVLLSSFGLRTREICQLMVSDVNFTERVVSIRRCKSRITQRFRLGTESCRALKRYLKVRPDCQHQNLFLTLRQPFGPIQQASVYNVTRTRIDKLGIETVNKGGHAIRHSCANQLLRSGISVPKVASLLGHAGSRYVGTYIQHSIAELRPVCDFKLRGLWNFRRQSRITSRESA
jgi:integrase/recombinase XerD